MLKRRREEVFMAHYSHARVLMPGTKNTSPGAVRVGTTAYLLAKQGKTIIVVDEGDIGSGADRPNQCSLGECH